MVQRGKSAAGVYANRAVADVKAAAKVWEEAKAEATGGGRAKAEALVKEANRLRY